MTMILESLLRSAFAKGELEYLRGQLEFATALERTYSFHDFERLCRIGTDLLEAESGPALSTRGYFEERSQRRAWARG
jgi:hypothetical protein